MGALLEEDRSMPIGKDSTTDGDLWHWKYVSLQCGLKVIPCVDSVLIELAVYESNENPSSANTHRCAIQ
jgi:hypothetical protein